MTDNFNINQLIVIGFDYKQSPIELREKVCFSRNNTAKAYKLLKNDDEILESIILSTCNRSEIYAVVKNTAIGKENIIKFYEEFFNINKTELKKFIIFRFGENAVRHIFEVASGFQSLVFGENQIIGQVKDSYENAIKIDSTGKILNRLFLNSITTAKKIKSLVGLSENNVSIGSIGVKLIENELKDLSNKSVLIVGFGEMSRIVIKNIMKKNVKNIFVTNRTKRKINDFAKDFPSIIEIDFDDRYKTIEVIDVIISCTSAPHYVIRKEKFLEHYTYRPLLVLDLAVPRDIEASINEISGIKIYGIDDLDKISAKNEDKRQNIMKKGLSIIEQDIIKFNNWTKEHKAINLILTIRDYSNKILSQKYNELSASFNNIDEKQKLLMEKEFNNLKKTFIHQSTVKIKELISKNKDSKEILTDFIKNAEFVK